MGMTHSILMLAHVLDTYGPRLSVEQLAQAIGMTPGAVYSAVSKGTLKVKTYRDSTGRWADARDVVQYLDDARKAAASGLETAS